MKKQWNKKQYRFFFKLASCKISKILSQKIQEKQIPENRKRKTEKKHPQKKPDKIDWSNMCISKLDFHLSACDSCVILKYRSEIIHSRWTSKCQRPSYDHTLILNNFSTFCSSLKKSQRSENLESNFLCPQFFQKTNTKKRMGPLVNFFFVFRSFFGRIEVNKLLLRFSDL